MPVKSSIMSGAAALALLMTTQFGALAEPPADPKAVTQDEDGVWRDKAGDPTYQDRCGRHGRLVDLFGLPPLSFGMPCLPRPRRRGIDLCAGAEEFASRPFDYAEFYGIVVSGRKDLVNGKDKVMPAFADNKNVMCYLNDIYVYLRARSDDAVPRGRPPKHADKPASFDANEDKCMSGG